MFEIGDKAVYPGHGVGIIERIETREVSGGNKSFYVLKILDNGMTIRIPTDHAEMVGLREIIPEVQVPRVFQILKEKDVSVYNQTWNRRYREYMEKINTGSIFEIAEVLRDLYMLKSEKELSFGERKILDTAKNLLVTEIAIAMRAQEKEIVQELRTILEN
ncbi:MAG: CarD family transcriptional regulator [Deltaproteobacteria bacterium]|nr:CarD family transcriptional regulator [Deltaproteobacteria bacterium]MBW2121033.1 CarD family transcriptional regulator [Deltaproteobacteria bacterium]